MSLKIINLREKILDGLEKLNEMYKSLEKYIEPYYDKAEEIAYKEPYNKDLETYTGHTLEHAREVMENAIKYKEAIENYFENNKPIDGDIHLETLYASAAFHDIGMGVEKEEYREKGLKAGKQLRNEHALNSGLELMKNKDFIKDDFEKFNVDTEKVAVIIYFHSKSCSGLEKIDENGNSKTVKLDLTNIDDVKISIENFKEECRINNIEFRGEFSDQEYKDIAIIASVIRIADANRDGRRITDMRGRIPRIDGEIHNNANTMDDEVENAKLVLGDKEYAPDNYTKAIYIGEGNCRFDLNYDKDFNKLNYDIHVFDIEKAPNSTSLVISERFGEIDSTFIKDNLGIDNENTNININIICSDEQKGRDFIKNNLMKHKKMKNYKERYEKIMKVKKEK